MFKAFLKKVEETANQLEQSLKIKDTAKPLDNIIKEIPPIPDSIKNIDLSLKSPGPPPIYYKENIDLHPGSIFLKKYQEKLAELHSNNVILAKKGEAVDRKLPTLLRETTNHHEMWKKMQGELARLPELSANVSNIRNQIDFVLVKIDELEQVLTAQVEIHHATELAKQKEKLVTDGLKYQAQKQKELASLEEELATAKARFERDKANKEKEQARLQRLEQEQQRRKKEDEESRERKKKQEQEQKERKQKEEEERKERDKKKQKEDEEKKEKDKLRSAFGTAFQQQMEQFKFFGNTGPSPKKEEPAVPVEAIVPEENPQALEEFFQDLVNSSDKLKKEAAGEEKVEGEKEKEKEKEEKEGEKEKEGNPLVKGEEDIGEDTKEKESVQEKVDKEAPATAEEKIEEKEEDKEKIEEKVEEKIEAPEMTSAAEEKSEEKTSE